MKIEIIHVDVCIRKIEALKVCKPLDELKKIVDEYVRDAASQFDEIDSDKDAIYQVVNIVDNIGLAIRTYRRRNVFHTNQKPVVRIKCNGGEYKICAEYEVVELNDEKRAMETKATLDVIVTTNGWGNGVINYDDDRSRPTFIRDREKEQLLGASDFCKIVSDNVLPI